jgi:hypothetical protein
MAFTIELPEAEERALHEKARAQGLTLEAYARQVLTLDLVPEWLRSSWRESVENGVDRLTAEEIEAEIAAARAARRRAP